MTLEIFHELLKDTSRCKNVFDEFIQKNRNIFDTIRSNRTIGEDAKNKTLVKCKFLL